MLAALVLGYPLALYAAARYRITAPVVLLLSAVLIVSGLVRVIRGHVAGWGIAAGGSALLAGLVFEPTARALAYAFPTAIYAMLCLVFARSLRAEREPLITRFARLEGGVLELSVLRYTRRLTWLWAALFASLATVCLLLVPVLSLRAWTVVASGLGPVLAGLLLVGEFQVRVRRFPSRRHDSFLQFFRKLVGTDIRALISG